MKIDCKKVAAIVSEYGGNRDSLISILQDIQTEYRYLPEDVLRAVASQLDLPLIQVYGVATFFKAFSLTPRGRHLINVCLGTACHVRGAIRILEAIERELGIKTGETTKDLKYTVERVKCVGACALGPIVIVDGKHLGGMKMEKVKPLLDSYD
jgi:NADH-quinone oxidoreductase subunit E